MTSSATSIQTVLGSISPNELGKTLTHEHLSLDFDVFYAPPPATYKPFVERGLTLDNIGLIRQYPYSSHENLAFYGNDVNAAVTFDVQMFKNAGGGTIVENTSHGLKRQIKLMETISRETGVNILAGCGYYVENTQPQSVRCMTQEQLYDSMLTEMTVGCADCPNVKCGFIGEVGSVWPITDFEKRAIQATALTQESLNCAVTFHPGRHHEAPFEIMRLYLEAGGSAKRAIMSHLDRTFETEEHFLDLVKLGCFCQFDLFGTECSYYQLQPTLDMPSDAQRVKMFTWLKDEGFVKHLLASHDVHTRHRLVKYGGHGYAHFLVNVVPKMLMKGFTQEEIDMITTENPRVWLSGERL